jgi:galactokinase
MQNLDLDRLYGPDSTVQQARYAKALNRFRLHYGPGPVDLFRAPGRVNIIGEHTDYNHGYVLPIALDKDILLLARPRADRAVNLANIEDEFPSSTFTLAEDIPRAAAGHWSNYVRGAAQTISQAAGAPPPGLDLLVDGSAPTGVPRGAGLSSSSAFTVAAVIAFAHFLDWHPARTQFVQVSSDAEWYVGTRGGIMDQYISLFAHRDHALFLDCRPAADGSYVTRQIPFPPSYTLVVADSGIHHANVRGEYNRRVAACRAGVALLRRHFPDITHLRDVEQIEWAALEPLLPEEITVDELVRDGVELGSLPGIQPDDRLRVRPCCRHVWHDNRRVLAALAALQTGDMQQTGQILDQGHASARDDYAISTPELDILCEAARAVPGVAGARLTGAGWGGCIIALAQRDVVEDVQKRLTVEYEQRTGWKPSVFVCRSGEAAGHVASITA